MRWILGLSLVHAGAVLCGQVPPQPAPSGLPVAPLPDSPGSTRQSYPQSITVTSSGLLPCPAGTTLTKEASSRNAGSTSPLCAPPENRNPYQRFLNSRTPLPLTLRQKGLLALHDVVDPGNLFTLTANAGFTVGIDPHTGYGPGWKGFGRDVGYSFVEDATGEFVSTFALDSLFHEDPHYHRSPKAPVPRRFMHAISHTVWSQHDDGRPMVNYSTLLTYPISAELSNLYVPGVHGNAESTVTRIVTGLATDPVDNIITEFLPDFAKRVHIRIIFVQQLLNKVASGQPL